MLSAPAEEVMRTRDILGIILIVMGSVITFWGLLLAEKQLSGRDIINEKVRVPGRPGGRALHIVLALFVIAAGVVTACIGLHFLTEDPSWILIYMGTVLIAFNAIWLSVMKIHARIAERTRGKEGIALDDFLLEKSGVARGSVQIGKKRYSACILYEPETLGQRVPPDQIHKTLLKRGSRVRAFHVKGVLLYLDREETAGMPEPASGSEPEKSSENSR